MKRMLRNSLFVLVLLTGLVSVAFSQKNAPTGRQGVLDQVRGVAGVNGGARASVQMVDAVDTNAAASGQFRAAVKDAFVYGNLQVPAGSTAMVTLVATTAGNTRTYTVSLVSLVVNGQTVPVAGASPTVAAGSVVRGRLGSVLGGAAGTPTTGVTPTATGTRVYLPAGTQVTFVLPAAPAAAGQPAVAAAAPVSQPVAAAAPVPQPVSATPQPVPTVTGANQVQPIATSNVVVYENVQYQLQSCQREAPHIVCQVQITNLGSNDLELGGGQQTYYVDQAGNKEMATSRRIANCQGYGFCQLLPGIAMAGRFEFMDQDGHATSLVRLQLWEQVQRTQPKAVAQFSNVPVQ